MHQSVLSSNLMLFNLKGWSHRTYTHIRKRTHVSNCLHYRYYKGLHVLLQNVFANFFYQQSNRVFVLLLY